jgi:hypothetical protein
MIAHVGSKQEEPWVPVTGVKSLVKPLSSWYNGSSKSSSGSSAQPVVTFDDLQQLPKPEPLTLAKQLRDDERVLDALVPAPVGTLLVAPDNLGRVLLLDGADMVAVRIWKVSLTAEGLPASAQPFVYDLQVGHHEQLLRVVG